MNFVRRFLVPVLLSSCLTLFAAGFLFGGDISSLFDGTVDQWAAQIILVGVFVSAGLLFLGYPAAHFLAHKDVPFWTALPMLLITGALAGAAINFLLSLSFAGHGTGYGPAPAFTLMGSLAGAITAGIWTAFNAEMFKPASPKLDE
jgi:hypothetical protein